ncbi:hypothetical protein BS47DRAFT_1356451, partial [Hydnum rufescens UP504]
VVSFPQQSILQHSPHHQFQPRPQPRPRWGQANTSSTEFHTESSSSWPLQYMTDQIAVYPGPPPPLVHISEFGKAPDEDTARVLLALSSGT